MPFPSMPCLVAQSKQDALLTTETDDGYITIVAPAGTPGMQEWIVEHRSDDKVTFRNLKFSDTYIGVNEIAENALAVASKSPQVFSLEQEGDSGMYYFYIEQDDAKLYLAYSMLKVYPPRAALLSPHFRGDPWKLRFLE